MKIAGRPANIAAGAPARDPGFVCCIPLFDGAAHTGSYSDLDDVVGDRLRRFVGWRTRPTPGARARGGCLGCVPYWQTMRRRRCPTAHAVFQDRPTFRRTPCRKHSLAGGPAAARTDGG